MIIKMCSMPNNPFSKQINRKCSANVELLKKFENLISLDEYKKVWLFLDIYNTLHAVTKYSECLLRESVSHAHTI